MNMTFTNYTEFGIHNSAVRYTWCLYGIFIILSSIIGDSIILVASIKYNAFKLHKTIVAIMQHMATCDIITSVNLTLFIASLLAEQNILGDFLCYARAYITYFTFPASFYFTAALTTSKAIMVKFPMQARHWSKRRAHMMCGGIWVWSLATPLLMFIVDKDDVKFDYREYVCYYVFSTDTWKFLSPVLALFTSVVPNVIVITTTAMLIVEAKKVAKRGRDSLRWQGLTTVILTAVVYCLSVVPPSLYYIVGNFVKDDKNGLFHVYFYRFAVAVVCINVMSNFYIYSLTVKSFRSFLLIRASLIKQAITGRGKIVNYIYKYVP